MPNRIQSAMRKKTSTLGGKMNKMMNIKSNKHKKQMEAEPTNLQSIKSKLAQNSLTELKLGFEEVDFYSKRDVQSLIKVIQEQFWQRVIVDKASPLQSIMIGWRLPKFAIGPVLQQIVPLLLQEPIRVTSIQLILNGGWIPEQCLKTIVSWHSLELLDLRSVRVRCPLVTTTSGSNSSNNNSSSPEKRRQHQHHQHHPQQNHGSTANGYVDSSTFAMLSSHGQHDGGDDSFISNRSSPVQSSSSGLMSPSTLAALSSSSSSVIHQPNHSSSSHHYYQHGTSSSSFSPSPSCTSPPPPTAFTSTTTTATTIATMPLSTSTQRSMALSYNTPGLWTDETQNVVCIIPFMSNSIKTLKLVDCNIQQQHISELCYHLRRRRNLSFLSLRQNRKLNGGLEELFQLPYIHTLDLSLCDLDPHNGYEIQHALLRQQPGTNTILSESSSSSSSTNSSHHHHHQQTQLLKLSLAGNYRLSEAIPSLVDVAADRLIELDCSHCDVQGKLQNKVFRTLAETKGCTMQSFRMQGTRILQTKMLVHCIQHNRSLRRLVLDHPREPSPLQVSNMDDMSKAMEGNYHLEDLKVDTLGRLPSHIQNRLDFWLTLNRCGRAAVLNGTDDIHSRYTSDDATFDTATTMMTTNKPWPYILGEAAKQDNPNIMFWLLKHGSASLCSQYHHQQQQQS